MPPGKLVGHEETLARFVVFSDWVNKNGEAKVALFLPDPSRTVSVYRIDGLKKARIKALNNAVDMARRGKLVNHGLCPLNASQVLARGFGLDPNKEPEYHTNIEGFGPTATKEADRAKALLLVQIAGKQTTNHLK